MKTIVYPGSFDPVTNGHLNIIERSAKIFDRVVVAVLHNTAKKPLFSIEERMDMLKRVTVNFENVEIDCFSGLLTDYMKQNDYQLVVKGLRVHADFEMELNMELMNKKLNNNIETFFMMTDNKYGYVSSSAVKEVARFNGDISDFVPEYVEHKLQGKYGGI
jgi:pantetheine-phosphate adenylyltransferase